MKLSKRLIYLVLSIAIVISSIPFIGYADTANDFPDLPSDWSKEALIKAVNNGLLTGANGKLMPFSNLTRAQMAAIVNKAFGATRMASLVEYTDVRPSAWYFRDMAIALQMGTFSGNNGLMNPDKPISREEVLTVLAKAFKLPAGNEQSIWRFRDSVNVSPWARPYVAAMIEAGYVNGSGGYLNPRSEIKRNEFAALMDNVVKHYITEPGVYTGTFNGNIIIRVPGVTFKDAVINGSLVIGDGVGTGQVYFSNVDIKGATLVRGQAQVVEGEPEDEGTPAGPGTPPVVIPPGGGTITPPSPPPVVVPVKKEYAFRFSRVDAHNNVLKSTVVDDVMLYEDEIMDFGVVNEAFVVGKEDIKLVVNDEANYITRALNLISSNSGKRYVVTFAKRVVNSTANFDVLDKTDILSRFVTIANASDATDLYPVTKELVNLLLNEELESIMDDIRLIYGPNEVVPSDFRFFYYANAGVQEVTNLKIVEIDTVFNTSFNGIKVKNLVGKCILKVIFGGEILNIELLQY